MTEIPFREIVEQARPFVETIVPRWVPGAVRKGGWMMVCSPFRDDKHPSFGVSLETGWFRDFATGDKGDLIDLLVRLRGISKVEAARELARIVGHRYGENQ